MPIWNRPDYASSTPHVSSISAVSRYEKTSQPTIRISSGMETVNRQQFRHLLVAMLVADGTEILLLEFLAIKGARSYDVGAHF
jgi:hypothetical protein